MKNILILLAVVGIAVGLWLAFPKKPKSTQVPPTAKEVAPITNINVPASMEKSAFVQPTDVKIPNEKTNSIIFAEQILQTNSASRKKIYAIAENKNGPVTFFGKVVDQDESPIAGVKIGVRIRTWYVTPTLGIDAHFPSVDKVSDSAGRFDIQNVKGDVLTIESLKKDGYEPEPSSIRDYGTTIGNLDDPMILKMWKTNIHEQLIIGEKRLHIAIDGRAYFIDLTKGIISESGDGDLKISVKYPAQTAPDQPNNWLAKMDAINGGLLEEPDLNSSMSLAPEDGYGQTFQHNQQIRNGQRGTTGQHRFYVMLKNGQEYGRITVEIFAPYNDEIPGEIDLKYAINPSGSRILR